MEEKQKQNEEMNKEIESKLKTKTEEIKANMKYYGEKCQELLLEVLSRQKYEQETGEQNSLSAIIKKLGIDAEQIKFNFEEEDFKSFE